MQSLHPKKLRHSKWTAVHPERKEKHFMITEVTFDDDGKVISCVMEAVMTRREFQVEWRGLKDESMWRQGWV
ncbi:MAG: TIGR02450 family Trp-rich protein [Pseudomonadota bacterium]